MSAKDSAKEILWQLLKMDGKSTHENTTPDGNLSPALREAIFEAVNVRKEPIGLTEM
jgi:hypothetical protein